MRSVILIGLVAISGCSMQESLPRAAFPPTSANEVEVVDSTVAGAVSLGTLDAYACAEGFIARKVIGKDEDYIGMVLFGLQCENS